MLVNESMIIRRLLESRSGTHLTCYLSVNDIETLPVLDQLQTVIKKAEGLLSGLMSVNEKEQFLRPVFQLLSSGTKLALMKGNIGIFRTHDSFHVLRLPVGVRTSCIVASSFHVKPLLKWFQSDQRFLLLGLAESEAHLYTGGAYSFRKLDSLLYSNSEAKVDCGLKIGRGRTPLHKLRPLVTSLHEWLDEHTKQDKPKLFVAGERHLTDVFIRARFYRNIEKTPVWSSFHENQVGLIIDVIRKMNRREQMLKFDKTIYALKHSPGRASLSDLDKIAQAVAQGSVKRLFIADNTEVFGEFDPSTGRIKIHPQDRVYEGDDILDDLAQAVLANGGEVIVAASDQLPDGSPILALVEHRTEPQPALIRKGVCQSLHF